MRILFLCLLITGCNYNPAIVADSVTTYAAIKSGGSELNPLLPKSAAGAALGSAALGLGMGYIARQQTPKRCAQLLKTTGAIKFGASANNLAVITGASGYVPLAVGVGTALALNNGKFNYENQCE